MKPKPPSQLRRDLLALGATPRQADVAEYVAFHVERTGMAPTMEDIAVELDVSKVTVFEWVGELVRKGILVRRKKHVSRSLSLSPNVGRENRRVKAAVALAEWCEANHVGCLLYWPELEPLLAAWREANNKQE